MGVARLMLLILWAAVGIANASDELKQRDPLLAAELRDVIDPPITIDSPVVAGTDSSETCELIATFIQQFPTTNRFRGNMYSFTSPGILRSFDVELTIPSGATELCFSILSRTHNQGTFQRVREDVTVFVNGGARRLYSTSEAINNLALELDAGNDYIFGVSWGGVSIGTSRDTRQYPQPFSHGQVSGSVTVVVDASGCLNFDPEDGLSVTGFAQAGHVMKLCFDKEPGACCCVGEGGCEEMLETSCSDAGGFFLGERVPCTPTQAGPRCVCGACCLPCLGECRNDVEAVACGAQLDGAFRGPGTQCAGPTPSPNDDLVCEVQTGACCTGGDCREVCESECESVNGVFKGVATTCYPSNPCRGACCVPGSPGVPPSGGNPGSPPEAGFCVELTQGICENAVIDGTFATNGTDCPTLPLETECGGVCCWGLTPQTRNRCAVVGSRTECSDLLNGVYIGDGIDTCNSATCASVGTLTIGACCLSDADGDLVRDCIVTTSDICTAEWIGGVFRGAGTTCNASACNNLATGACCYGDGQCQANQTQPDCVTGANYCDLLPPGAACVPGAGAYLGDATTCGAGACAAHTPEGACCDNGVCSTTTESQCTAAGGTYRGNGSSCLVGQCPGVDGACCISGVGCERRSPGSCASAGGVYAGNGVSCQNADCDYPTGACCASDGSCSILTSFNCSFVNGDYRGDDVACAEAQCPQPPRGACCIEETGECLVVSEAVCAASGGNYTEDDVPCTPTLCPAPVTGACCLPNGTCQVRGTFSCDQLDGIYQGNNTLCETTNCPQPTGSCCFVNGTCQQLTQADCTTAGSSNWTMFATCVPNLCPQPTGACCFASGRPCEVITTAQCTTAGGTYGGDDSECSTCPVPATGACCDPANGDCQSTTQFACQQSNRNYQGAGTVCSPSPCPQPAIGACCVGTNCLPDVTQAVCTSNGGTFFEGGICDDDVSCVPEGACCRNGDCFDGQTSTACNGVGGEYRGDGTTCAASGNCELGACCNGTTCTSKTEVGCTNGGGTYIGDGATCSPNPCAPATGSCCVTNLPCSVVTQAECDSASGQWTSGEDCNPDPCPQPPSRACCVPGGGCQVLTEAACSGAGGNWLSESTDCNGVICAVDTGACCDGSVCELTPSTGCISPRTFLGPGTTCSPINDCAGEIDLVSADPQNNSIDARQNATPTDATPIGISVVSLTFDGRTDGLSTSDFSVTELPNTATPPVVLSIAPNGETIQITLDRPITAEAWTIIRFVPSGTETCLGFLPGDVNGDRTTATLDIIALINSLNNVVPVPAIRSDVDRSGATNSQDIIRVIDLLNGAGQLEIWLGVSIPASPCAP